MTFAIAVLVGLIVGALSGLLGIGGGTIMVPVLRLLFGLSPLEATATSLFTIIPTSLSGAWKHAHNHTCVPRLGMAAGVAGACMSPFGVWCATRSPGWLVMGAAALVIIYSSFSMFRSAYKSSSSYGVCESNCEGGCVDARNLDRRAYVIGGVVGLLAGFLGGYVGVGGGFIIVPLFVTVLGISMKQASGTSLIAVLFIAIPATIEQALLGNISYLYGIAFALGSIPGAIVGASLVKYVPERLLKYMFSIFLVVVAVLLMANEFGVMG